jgi:2-methylisocitrate lyase-like PEP mutase family enzyme
MSVHHGLPAPVSASGYGNAMNVKRTVRGYAQAGFAGKLYA